jgi:hypothetical protein
VVSNHLMFGQYEGNEAIQSTMPARDIVVAQRQTFLDGIHALLV